METENVSYEDKEEYVLYAIHYSATPSESNALSLDLMRSQEAKRYTELDALITSPGARNLSTEELTSACQERAELEPVLAGMVVRELKRRGLA